MNKKIDKYIIIILIAFLILMNHAWVPGFFQDGYLYAEMGKNALQGGHWLIPHLSSNVYFEFSQHTPFTFILEGMWFAIFGTSYIAARGFAAIFYLLTLLFMLRFLKREHSSALAIGSGIIFVVMPPLLKKAHFPNIDIPLMFFVFLALQSYYKAYRSNDWKSWISCGLFFGLAMLTKGPLAAYVPAAIGVHLVVTKNWKQFTSVKVWTALILSFVIFALWPLALWLAGRMDIFWEYLNFTFVGTISEARGVVESSPFTYVKFFLIQSGPWFILAFIALGKVLKHQLGEIEKWAIITFFTGLVLISIPTFKYSNYLIPLYPFLAISAAAAIVEWLKKYEDQVLKGFIYIGFIVLAIMLIFPVTSNIKRDRPIFQVMQRLDIGWPKSRGKAPQQWIIVDESYPFWSLNNLVAWHDVGIVKRISSKNLLTMEHQTHTIWIVPCALWQTKAITGKFILQFRNSCFVESF